MASFYLISILLLDSVVLGIGEFESSLFESMNGSLTFF